MTTFSRPAAFAWRCIVSDSAMLRRQPKVTTSTAIRQRRRKMTGQHALVLEFRPARSSGHGSSASRHAITRSPPGSVIVASRPVRPFRDAATSGRAGGRAAGARQPGAALPHMKQDAIRREDLGERDIGALGKYRVVFQSGPMRARSYAAASSTQKIACGLPMSDGGRTLKLGHPLDPDRRRWTRVSGNGLPQRNIRPGDSPGFPYPQ